MNGASTHGGNSGVNLYTYFPTDSMVPGYVALKVEIIHGTRLKGGSACRLCVNGRYGELNTEVQVNAVVFDKDEVPDMARLA